MSSKVYDICVKTGEYTDRNGQTKGRWKNVGAVMRGSDNNSFLILDRTFNLAGIPNPENRDTVLCSLFRPQEQGQQGQQGQGQNQGQAPAPAPAQGNPANDIDPMPF